MDKLMLFFQRRDGLSSSEFHRHYLETHAPMATAWARVIHRYVVNLTDQPPQPLDSLGFTHRTEGGFDAITEAWVDSVPDFFDDRKCFADPEQARKMAADHHSFIGTMHGYRVSEELTDHRIPAPAAGRTPGVKLVVITWQSDTGASPKAEPLDLRAPATSGQLPIPHRYVSNRVIEPITPEAPHVGHIIEITVPTPRDLSTVLAVDAVSSLQGSPSLTSSWHLMSEYVQRPAMRMRIDQ
ncbi:MAG: hypothetical protein E6G39_12325 [Actinobacteria bacterium]|nr:MAG: hypothetical protein E6G39_12325 [Actinomycetota bacterium]